MSSPAPPASSQRLGVVGEGLITAVSTTFPTGEATGVSVAVGGGISVGVTVGGVVAVGVTVAVGDGVMVGVAVGVGEAVGMGSRVAVASGVWVLAVGATGKGGCGGGSSPSTDCTKYSTVPPIMQ